MTVLVTGAGGFLGRHLVAHLAAGDDAVRAMVRPGGSRDPLPADVEAVEVDVLDAAALERAAEGCSVVYHLAARTSYGGASRSAMFAVNVDGTRNVARAAARGGARRLVFVSSAAVHGVVRGRTLDETSPLDPRTPYADSKVRAEQLLTAPGAGVPVVIARPSALFGAGAKSWLGLCRTLAAGTLRLPALGPARCHPADVADVCRGLQRCATVPGIEGRRYLLSGPAPVTLAWMLGALADAVGGGTLEPVRAAGPRAAPALLLRGYDRLQRVARALGAANLPRFDRVEFFASDRVFDLSRARDELGFRPEAPLLPAIEATVAWYRTRGLLPAGGPGPCRA